MLEKQEIPVDSSIAGDDDAEEFGGKDPSKASPSMTPCMKQSPTTVY